jgi:hypothetical protein
MKLDTLFAILALVIGIVPLLLVRKEERLKTLVVTTSLCLIAFALYRIYVVRVEDRIERVIAEDITQKLNTNGPLPFDDLYARLYPCDYAAANSALDSLVESHFVVDELIDVVAIDGKPYRIKRFRLSQR